MNKYSCDELSKMEPVQVYKLLLEGKIERFPRGFISEYNQEVIHYDTCNKVVKYFIEEVLRYKEDEVYNLVKLDFEKCHLSGMLTIAYNNSVYTAVNSVYPDKYLPWNFKYLTKNFWNKDNAKVWLKWLLEEKCKLSLEEIPKVVDINFFYENDFLRMLENVYNKNVYLAIKDVYPGIFKPWELKSVPQNFWNLKTAKEAVIWLIEEKLKWDEETVYKNLNIKVFNENRLGGMVSLLFKSSPIKALENAYPLKYKVWRFKIVRNNYWNEDTVKEAIKWLIEEKLKYSLEEVYEKLGTKDFSENGMGSMLKLWFGSSYVKAVMFAYPNIYKPWLFVRKPKNFWNDDKNVKDAISWLQIKVNSKYPKYDDYKNNRLLGLILRRFNANTKNANDYITKNNICF